MTRRTKKEIELEKKKMNEFLENWRNKAFTTPNGEIPMLINKLFKHRQIISDSHSEIMFLAKISNLKNLTKIKKGIMALSDDLKKYSEELSDLLIEDADIVE